VVTGVQTCALPIYGTWLFEDKNTGVAGERVKSGAIKVAKPGSAGQFEYYPFDFRYQVADLGVAVSPDKMNVFYIGVENPVTISVTGMTSDKVNASLSGGMGKITKKTGSEYVVTVDKVGETDVVVSGVGADGKSKQLDSKKFRVKRVPDPVAKVGTLAGGKVATATFKVQRGVIADLADFVFDVRFAVVSFELTYAAKRQDLIIEKATSGAFTSKMLELMSRAKPGDTFYLDEVRVKGPDNQIRKLPSASYSLI
jgi:gliding motility-associated protein GldM